MNNIEKEAILGFAGGYSLAVILPFIKTLRKTGYSGNIILFCDSLSHKEIETGQRKYGVSFQNISPEKPFYLNNHEPNSKDFGETMSPNVKRYFSYLHYITHNEKLEKIAIADTRDIIFQKNPFNDLVNWGKINLFLEDDFLKIGDSEINSGWITRGYGKTETMRLKDNIVSCSGYTIGGREAMLEYLKELTNEFEKLVSQNIKMGGGIDQGVHNFLIYNSRFKNSVLHKNHGNSFNIILSGTSNFIYKNNLVKSSALNTISVVHQYDRVPYLLKKYNFREYIKGINYNAIKNKISRLIQRSVE